MNLGRDKDAERTSGDRRWINSRSKAKGAVTEQIRRDGVETEWQWLGEIQLSGKIRRGVKEEAVMMKSSEAYLEGWDQLIVYEAAYNYPLYMKQYIGKQNRERDKKQGAGLLFTPSDHLLPALHLLSPTSLHCRSPSFPPNPPSNPFSERSHSHWLAFDRWHASAALRGVNLSVTVLSFFRSSLWTSIPAHWATAKLTGPKLIWTTAIVSEQVLIPAKAPL